MLKQIVYLICAAVLLGVFGVITTLSAQVMIVAGVGILAIYNLFNYIYAKKRRPTTPAARETGNSDFRKCFIFTKNILRFAVIFLVASLSILFIIFRMVSFLSFLFFFIGMCFLAFDEFKATNEYSDGKFYIILRNFFFLGFIFFMFNSLFNIYNKVPIELPFYPDKVGETYAFDVTIKEQTTYSVALCFYHEIPNKWSGLLNNEKLDPIAFNRFREVYRANNSLIPVKFNVRIVRKNDDEVILNEAVDYSKEVKFFSYGLQADLAQQDLKPGIYTISVEYLEAPPEMYPLHVTIYFTTTNPILYGQIRINEEMKYHANLNNQDFGTGNPSHRR